MKIIITSSLPGVFVTAIAKISILGYFPQNPIFAIFGILAILGHFWENPIFVHFQENPKIDHFWKNSNFGNFGYFGYFQENWYFCEMVIFADFAKKVKNDDFWKNEENDENNRSAKMTEICQNVKNNDFLTECGNVVICCFCSICIWCKCGKCDILLDLYVGNVIFVFAGNKKKDFHQQCDRNLLFI